MHRRDMMLQRSVAGRGTAVVLALAAMALSGCSSREGYPSLAAVPDRPTAVQSLAQRARIAKELTLAEKAMRKRAADPLAPAPALPKPTLDETIAPATTLAGTTTSSAPGPRRHTERRSTRNAGLDDFLAGIADEESGSGVVINEAGSGPIAPDASN